MKVTDFAKKVTEQEGQKKNLDIAQISEVLKITNNLLNGQLYSAIKSLSDAPANILIVNPKSGRVVTSKQVKAPTKKQAKAGKVVTSKK